MTTVAELLRAALLPLGLPVHPDGYDGEDETYWVYACSSAGEVWGDDGPTEERWLCTAQLYTTYPASPSKLLRKGKWALYNAGFTWPSQPTGGIEDGRYRHYPLECEYLAALPDEEED